MRLERSVCQMTLDPLIIIITEFLLFCSQELIQNADDAEAKTVHFYVDHRDHDGESNLLDPKLKKYQGPSLIVYNDAKFEDEDWKGIQMLQRSVKADDPFKVGKFGIGFNSVYHLTGMQHYKQQFAPCRHACGIPTQSV